MKTMHDEYGDGSDHEVCERCGFRKTCGDCNCNIIENKNLRLKNEIKKILRNTRKCVVCDKIIPIKKRKMGYVRTRRTEIWSDFGVYFDPYHVWFCNDCAKEVFKK